MIIAIDGPAASGKGTLGKRLAQHYGYRHLDTGVIYRAVAYALMESGHDLRDEAAAVAAALGAERCEILTCCCCPASFSSGFPSAIAFNHSFVACCRSRDEALTTPNSTPWLKIIWPFNSP